MKFPLKPSLVRDSNPKHAPYFRFRNSLLLPRLLMRWWSRSIMMKQPNKWDTAGYCIDMYRILSTKICFQHVFPDTPNMKTQTRNAWTDPRLQMIAWIYTTRKVSNPSSQNRSLWNSATPQNKPVYSISTGCFPVFFTFSVQLSEKSLGFPVQCRAQHRSNIAYLDVEA